MGGRLSVPVGCGLGNGIFQTSVSRYVETGLESTYIVDWVMEVRLHEFEAT